MKQQAILAYPLECCGLLLGRIDNGCKKVIKVIPTENDWENQKDLFEELNSEFDRHDSKSFNDRECRDSFSINPLTFLKIQKQARQDNLDILGIYHSHPNHSAQPSSFDTQFAWSIYSYIILSVNNNDVEDIKCWLLDENRQFIEEGIKVNS